MDTIAIRYIVPKLNFAVIPSGNQTFNLHYRLIEDIQDTGDIGWISAGEYTTDNLGNNINNIALTGLLEGFDYQLKFTHSSTGERFYCYFRTCNNTSAGDSPYYNVILFPNQTYDWFVSGADKLGLPAVANVGWYYELKNNRVCTVQHEAYNNLDLYGESSWSTVSTYDNTDETYKGFYCNNAAVGLPFKKGNDGDITSVDVAGRNFGYSFYLSDTSENIDILCSAKFDTSDNVINWWALRFKNAAFYTVKSIGGVVTENIISAMNIPIESDRWYNVITDLTIVNIYTYTEDIPMNRIASIYLGDSRPWAFDDFMDEGNRSPIIIGNPTLITTGMTVNRFYLASGAIDTNPSVIKIMANYKYSPYPIYYINDAIVYKDNAKHMPSIKPDKVSLVVDPDILSKPDIVEGPITIKLAYGLNNDIFATKNFTLKSVQSNMCNETFIIDFEKDYTNAMKKLKEMFYTKHGTWGGYNGGTNSNLIFGNGKDALIIENHGDKYTGSVVGVGKETDAGSAYTGYGTPKSYDAFNDIRKGQPFKTRVGSVLVSSKYFPYGELEVVLSMPSKIYGICPAFWFFHYQEYGEGDTRYQEWINKGWPQQGSAEDGYYTVVNNEIDIELPSHIIQKSFNDWTEVANEYFDPLALDTQYRIGLKQSPTNISLQDIGTFILTDVKYPNARSSWKQESYQFEDRLNPNFGSIKFNNWQGELDTGHGCAESKEYYDKHEKYLALMTKITDDTLADNKYHSYLLKWYPDRTELWIDGKLIRINKCFVPFNVMKYTVGGWFPSMKRVKVIDNVDTGEYHWEVYDSDTKTTVVPGVDPVGTWAGAKADFEICHLKIAKIAFKPYTDVDMKDLQYAGESFPESGLREII